MNSKIHAGYTSQHRSKFLILCYQSYSMLNKFIVTLYVLSCRSLNEETQYPPPPLPRWEVCPKRSSLFAGTRVSTRVETDGVEYRLIRCPTHQPLDQRASIDQTRIEPFCITFLSTTCNNLFPLVQRKSRRDKRAQQLLFIFVRCCRRLTIIPIEAIL